MNNTAEEPKFAPVWGDLDDQFNAPDQYELEEVFDTLVARQADEYGDTKEPCPEAQELLDQWTADLRVDDPDADGFAMWQAAVARRQAAEVPDEAVSEGSGADEDAGPQYLNDAEILGTEPEGLGDFLSREASFLIGEMWGQRDRRNTQDTEWKTTTMSWGAWIGGQEGTKNAPAWGFSRHPVGKDKAGSSIVLGSSVGGARKAKAMDTMFAMGLDIDSGAKLNDVLDTVEEKNILCFVYTSYNNGKRGIELKRDEVLRKLQITSDPTNAQVRQFLREFDKNRYEETFIAECSIKEQKHQTTEGVKIVLDTPPLEKFRLIFPLADPVKIIDLAETHQAALDLWEDKITGLARNVLGVHFDTSCTDPSRLFYTARHPKGSDDWYAAIVMGEPLTFDSIPAMKKAAYTSNREDNPFTQAGAETEGSRREYKTPSGASLNEWHSAGGKNRFMIADLLETLCADKIRVAGGEAQGHVHIECPFEHEHTSEGGTATMAINCLDSQNEYWTIFCHHDACQGRHKLQFLEEMLRQGWFDESALFDPSEGFLLEVEDGEDDPFEPVEAKKERARTFEEQAEEIDETAPWSEIEDFCKRIYKEGADKTAQVNVAAIIAKNTNHTRASVKAVFKELDGAARKVLAAQARELTTPVVNEWDFAQMHEHSAERIREANRESPSIFHNAHDLCAVRAGSDGRHAIRALDKDGFAHHLNSTVRFVKVVGEEKTPIGVAAPQDVVNYLYAADRSAYPPLRGLVTTPAFTAAGELLTQPGYDWDSQLFFQPDSSLTIPEVSNVPTEEEVFEAKRLLVQEVLADFMLDGLDRAETIRKALCCEEVGDELRPIPGAEPEATPSLSHAIVMAVFPFVRDMIGGNAAGIAIDKKKPGAGAGKLEAAMSTIYNGRGSSALALPTNPDDMTKVLLPALRSGRSNVFFDNINEAVDSGELASAMTAPTYEARILGKSETAEVDVRSQWVVAGCKLRLSHELIRRFALIYLDPKTATPEARTGFRHPEIEAWVRENRGQLIWACLTLVQNWIAGGRQPGIKDKASYSQWARIMGGILDAAGIKGFLGNEKDMKARSSVSDDPVRQLIERLADHDDGQLFVTGSVAKRHPNGTASIKAILESFHEDEVGDAQSLRLRGWGYDAHDGTYSNPQYLGIGFKRDVAAEPHKVGDVELSFEPVENASGVKLWRMVKRNIAKAG
ncbi:hypothetical protein [Tritonibacter mobilis]|uniref:hypothetical protein n=1 Tax=Tritonibacter mobilis TaxID=379347 RepID=UPI003A5C0674